MMGGLVVRVVKWNARNYVIIMVFVWLVNVNVILVILVRHAMSWNVHMAVVDMERVLVEITPLSIQSTTKQESCKMALNVAVIVVGVAMILIAVSTCNVLTIVVFKMEEVNVKMVAVIVLMVGVVKAVYRDNV
jgi:hypothetical protein